MPNDQKPPTYDANVKLCRAVQEFPCIYDRESPNYVKKEAYDVAWEAIANTCGEPAATCKVRWRNLRTAFIRSVQGTPKMRLPNRTREYYLHEVLQFFIPHITSVEPERVPECDKEANSEKQKAADKPEDDIPKAVADKDVKEAQKEQTTVKESVEEHVNKQTEKLPFKSKVKTFFIKQNPPKVESSLPEKTSETDFKSTIMESSIYEKISQSNPNDTMELLNNKMHLESVEIDSSLAETDKSIDDEGRFRFRRACKRGLDKTMVRELRVRKKDPEVKRPRRTIDRVNPVIKGTTIKKALDVKKHLHGEENQNYLKDVVQTEKVAILPTEVIETQIKSVAMPEKASEENLPNSFTNANFFTPPVQQNELRTTDIISNNANSVSDQSVQCKLATTILDDDFLMSLKPHLDEMNSRQKLYFKKKVYESMMEVFDNPTNFPQKGDETLSTPNTPPIRISATSEELRLTRELVALVQAAKHTPEVLNISSNDVAESITNETKDTPDQSALSNNNTKNDAFPNTSHQEPALCLPSNVPTQKEIDMQHKFVRKMISLDSANIAPGGERRRIYRIFPRGSLGAISPSNGVGTFVIPQTSAPTSTSTTSYGKSRNPQIYKYTNQSTAIPPSTFSTSTNKSSESSSAVNSNSSSVGTAGQRTMTIRSRVRTSPNGTPRQIVRRYSICGPPTTIGGQSISTSASTTTNALKAFPATLNALVGTNTRTFLAPLPRRSNPSDLFKIPQIAGTVTTSSTKTTTAASIGSAIPISGYTQFMNHSNSVTASANKTKQLPSTSSTSTYSEKSAEKSSSKQRNPETVEKNFKKAETVQETAGIIASDNFTTMNIKNEPMDETFL